MDNIVKVYISGPALSLLLYENLRCLYNQEGFLIGKKYDRKMSKITDHDETVEIIEWEIHISSVVPCPKLASFYNGSGTVVKDALVSILNNLSDDVVGWFTFKREPEVKLRLREKIIHKNLSAIFSTDCTEHFVWCINNTIDNQEKHTSKQAFIRYIDSSVGQIGAFQELPLHIINLSDSRNDYKSAGIPSDYLNDLIVQLKKKSPAADNNSLIAKLEDAFQNKITATVKHVSESEQELFQLENEIYMLTHRRETLEAENDIRSADDYLIDGNDYNDDVGIVEECSKSKNVTRRKKERTSSSVGTDQLSPVNGVNLNKDRDGSSISTSPTSPSAPSTRRYSQAAKGKQ